MTKEVFIAETKYNSYFLLNDEGVIMYRLQDGKRYDISEINEGSLFDDISKGEITKIAPTFIYNYKEILKDLDKGHL